MRHFGLRIADCGFLSAGLAIVLLAGCNPGRIDAPRDYVAVRDPIGYDFKAVSARGNVFAMTSRENPNKDAGLEFWTQAVEHHKVDLDGYRLTAREAIKTRSGLDGTLFDLRTGAGAAEYTYLLALFVTPQRIYTVESAGPTPQFGADVPHVRAAIESLRP